MNSLRRSLAPRTVAADTSLLTLEYNFPCCAGGRWGAQRRREEVQEGPQEGGQSRGESSQGELTPLPTAVTHQAHTTNYDAA